MNEDYIEKIYDDVARKLGRKIRSGELSKQQAEEALNKFTETLKRIIKKSQEYHDKGLSEDEIVKKVDEEIEIFDWEHGTNI